LLRVKYFLEPLKH